MPAPFVLVGDGLGAATTGDRVPLADDAVHHLRRVLRRNPGDPLELCDGAGTVVPARLDRDGHATLTGAPVTVPRPAPRLRVLQALAKGRKHDDVVRVLTELGVDQITAITSDRTVVDLGAKTPRTRARWVAVARAACEQARRARLPIIDGPLDLAGALAAEAGQPLLVADVDATTDPLAAVGDLAADRVVLAIGPEGGWTQQELDAFATAGAVTVTLGPSVLRTEHAASVLAAVVAAATGRMRPVAARPWSIDSPGEPPSHQRPADNDAP